MLDQWKSIPPPCLHWRFRVTVRRVQLKVDPQPYRVYRDCNRNQLQWPKCRERSHLIWREDEFISVTLQDAAKCTLKALTWKLTAEFIQEKSLINVPGMVAPGNLLVQMSSPAISASTQASSLSGAQTATAVFLALTTCPCTAGATTQCESHRLH